MKSLALISALLFPLAVHAASDGALSLSPAVVSLRGDFGQSTTQRLMLTNGTSRPFSFDLVAQDVVVEGGVRTFLNAGSVSGSIAATAVFSERHVEVAPGASVTVSATFTLPAGTRQRAVTALFRGTNRVMSGNVPITASLGALLTFTLSDNVDLDATSLEVRPQSASDNLGVSNRCTNVGTEPLVAHGVLAVLDGGGLLVGRTAIPPRRLLPGELANLSTAYPGELKPGHYRLLVTWDYEGRSARSSAEIDVR